MKEQGVAEAAATIAKLQHELKATKLANEINRMDDQQFDHRINEFSARIDNLEEMYAKEVERRKSLEVELQVVSVT